MNRWWLRTICIRNQESFRTDLKFQSDQAILISEDVCPIDYLKFLPSGNIFPCIILFSGGL